MSLRATGGSLQMPVMPSGTEIASYRTYAEAQAAVDFLSDEEFDVKSITIVGIPVAIANIKMIPITCFPFGKMVVTDPKAII